ncbi:MAG TPA: cysteine hydrolase [Gemmatimonadales bacterium]|nr:cysteine hydrolase [Gemmatimonadales bacterium]
MDHAFGLIIPLTLDEVCRPDRTALVVYDMQVGIVSQIPTGQEITGRVRRVLQAARDEGVRVFFTRHMSLPNEVAGVAQLRTAMAWQRVDRAAKTKPAFPRDSPQFQLVPDLTPLANEAVFDKITMSAFVGTPLDAALRDCGINSFVIVGIALEIGIEPTVRHATDLGYIPILVEDACGWRDAAAAQRARAQLAFVGGSFATDTDTIVAVLRGGSGHPS